MADLSHCLRPDHLAKGGDEMSTDTIVKPKTVELLKHCEQGIRIRIFDNLYRYSHLTGEYTKAVENQWAAYTPTDRIKQIIDEKFTACLKADRAKVLRQQKHEAQMAFLDRAPTYMNSKKRQSRAMSSQGWRNH